MFQQIFTKQSKPGWKHLVICECNRDNGVLPPFCLGFAAQNFPPPPVFLFFEEQTQRMHLVIFDLDGTLTQTYYGDDNSYIEALSELLPIDPDYKYWKDCSNLTDSAVLDHIYNKVAGRSPETHEIAAMQERFLAKLEAKRHATPQFFEEIPGAVKAIEHLLDRNDTLVGVATGGWKQMAQFKLEHASFPLERVHLIGSDEHFAKRDFVAAMMGDLKQAHALEDFHSVNYVGDSRYDYRAAQELGIGFVGMDYNNAGWLKETAAATILPHYHDLNQFVSALGLR